MGGILIEEKEKNYFLEIPPLNSTVHDVDLVILHACFQLLKNCVESEALFDSHINWDVDEELRSAKIEIQSLYSWWNLRQREETLGRLDSLSRSQYALDNEMLTRLINVRHFLWT